MTSEQGNSWTVIPSFQLQLVVFPHDSVLPPSLCIWLSSMKDYNNTIIETRRKTNLKIKTMNSPFFNKYNNKMQKNTYYYLKVILIIVSVQLSRSVVSDYLWPHESQCTRPPCPSPTPVVHTNPCPLVGDAIQQSHPLSSPSPPAPNPSQHQSLFQWVNSSHEVSKVLEFQL